MAKLIKKIYSEALFSVATEKGMVDTLKEEADEIRQVLADNKEFELFLNHPNVIKEEKIRVIKNVFKDRVSEEMLGFLVTVIEKGRQKDINDIFKCFDDMVMEYKHIGKCTVKSALPLSDEQKRKIENKLLETTHYSSFEIEYQVDRNLIGGVVIRIGDCVVDGSVKSKLDRLTRELIKVKLA